MTNTKQYTPKLDADDQEAMAQAQARTIKAAMERSLIPKAQKSAAEIAGAIANEFFPVASLQHADLRRQIIKAIEAERSG